MRFSCSPARAEVATLAGDVKQAAVAVVLGLEQPGGIVERLPAGSEEDRAGPVIGGERDDRGRGGSPSQAFLGAHLARAGDEPHIGWRGVARAAWAGLLAGAGAGTQDALLGIPSSLASRCGGAEGGPTTRTPRTNKSMAMLPRTARAASVAM
jgi:hypothetical protein